MEPEAFCVLGKDSTTALQAQASARLPLSLFSPLSAANSSTQSKSYEYAGI